MGRVTREEDPSTIVALSNEQMWVPRIRNEGLECERTAREAVDQRRLIDFIQSDVGREKCVQGPDVPIVLRDHCRLRGLIVPGNTPRLQNVARVGAKVHHVKLSDPRNSVVTNIHATADLADATIASDKILTLNLFSPAGFDVLHSRDYGIRTLNELLERNADCASTVDSASIACFRTGSMATCETRIAGSTGCEPSLRSRTIAFACSTLGYRKRCNSCPERDVIHDTSKLFVSGTATSRRSFDNPSFRNNSMLREFVISILG